MNRTPLWVLAVAVALHAGAALAAPLYRIVVTVSALGDVAVKYQLPKDSDVLIFSERDPQINEKVRKRFWHIRDECAALADRGVRLSPGCRSVTIDLRWDETVRDRVYPGLIHLAAGGVLIYAPYIALDVPPGRVLWDIHGASRSVIDAYGQRGERKLVLSAGSAPGWIYVGPDLFKNSENASVAVDSGVAESTATAVNDTLPRLIHSLTNGLARKLPRKPRVFVMWSRRELYGQGFQADVAGGDTLRITLFGREWATPSKGDLDELKWTVAHEVAHLWNHGIYMPAPEQPAWLHEGNSELLALIALKHIGELTLQQAVQRLESGANLCAVSRATATLLGRGEADARSAPYQCGLTAEFLLGITTVDARPGTTPFSFWRDYWRLHPTYSMESLFEYAASASGKTRSEIQEIAQRVLHGGVDDMRSSLAAAGLVDGDVDAPTAALGGAILRHALVAVMAATCRHQVAVWSGTDQIAHVSGGSGCKAVPADLEVLHVENVSAIDDPVGAARAIAETCEHRGRIRFGTADNQVQLECTGEVAQQIRSGISMFKLKREAVDRGT